MLLLWYLIVVLIYVSLMANEAECFSHVLICHHNIHLDSLFQSFACFTVGLVVFLLLSFDQTLLT